MKILFVCTGNTCRSAMAEAFFNADAALVETGHKASSAGTDAYPGMTASPGAMRAAGKRNVDLSRHKAASLTDRDLADFDLILTMTSGHAKRVMQIVDGDKTKIKTLKSFACDEEGDIADPFGGDEEDYEACAFEIERALKCLRKKFFTDEP